MSESFETNCEYVRKLYKLWDDLMLTNIMNGSNMDEYMTDALRLIYEYDGVLSYLSEHYSGLWPKMKNGMPMVCIHIFTSGCISQSMHERVINGEAFIVYGILKLTIYNDIYIILTAQM